MDKIKNIFSVSEVSYCVVLESSAGDKALGLRSLVPLLD
jgi:hypothetical protein